MARKAWYEMRDHFNGDDNNPVERMPEVMAALAIGDHVYFASSVTGGHGTPFFYTIQGMQQAVSKSIPNYHLVPPILRTVLGGSKYHKLPSERPRSQHSAQPPLRQ